MSFQEVAEQSGTYAQGIMTLARENERLRVPLRLVLRDCEDQRGCPLVAIRASTELAVRRALGAT